MAYVTLRLRQKTDSGYDIFHLESRSNLILRFTDNGTQNGTVEDALQSLESAVNNMGGDVSDKATKVSGATAGNFAGLNSSGDLTDSGSKSSDFAAASHTHPLANVTGTASRALVTNGSGQAAVSTVTAAELAFLSGTTSSVQTQLNNKAASNHNHDTVYIKLDEKGTAIPTLTDGKIDSQYLPSYVDDVLDGTYVSTTVFNDPNGTAYTAESGKIYVDTASNKTYRWSGSQYVEISAGVTLGTTSATAYRGDYGQIAYTHSQSQHARPDATLTAASTTNGNIQINGAQVIVYTHPSYAGTQTSATATSTGTIAAITAVSLLNGHVSGYTRTTYTLPAAGIDIQVSSTQPTDQATNDLWFETLS